MQQNYNAAMGSLPCETPVATYLEIIDLINALYQDGTIGPLEKDDMAKLAEEGRDVGDYFALSENVFRMRAKCPDDLYDQILEKLYG